MLVKTGSGAPIAGGPRSQPAAPRNGLDDDALHVRFGLRASATIPYSTIASIDAREGEWQKRKGTLKVAIADDPRTIIRLREPMTIQFIAGTRKTIDAIAILPDDDGFEEALRARLQVALASD